MIPPLEWPSIDGTLEQVQGGQVGGSPVRGTRDRCLNLGHVDALASGAHPARVRLLQSDFCSLPGDLLMSH